MPANNLTEAIATFPQAMETEMARLVQELQKMQAEEQKTQRQNDSRIIVPGR
ncbi:hypothetical protein [Desulfosarcina cetonica]|uniref:hypothetical protein n=1 Tax=Desulfosarcina cetonica TaxID=90730 RepID=UPI001FEF9195|nr:hypothetical protein [Desulfosarcina cetonica]